MRLSVRALMVLIVLLAVMMLLARLVYLAREAARDGDCRGQLTQYGLALRNYTDAFGSLPAAYATDLAGTPIHSWRVAPLHVWPELRVSLLYDFNVPWNHANNAGLINYDTPGLFWWCPSGNGRVNKMTDYVAVVGSRTAWPAGRGRKLSEITDDPASTILLLEVTGSGIHWMEPRDLTIDQVLASGLGSHHEGYVNALFADWSVRRIRTDVSRETLKALLTVNGGETIDPASW
jgi:prepilin-type processing-associated H-X9-DG protein